MSKLEGYDIDGLALKLEEESNTTGERAGPLLVAKSSMILSESIVDSAAAVISSNVKLAKSNEKYTRAIVYLTGALVLVGLLQAILAAAPLLRDYFFCGRA